MSSVPSHFTNVKTEAQRREGLGLFVARPGFRLQPGFLAVSLGAEHLTEAEKKSIFWWMWLKLAVLFVLRSSPTWWWENAGCGCRILTQLLPQGASACAEDARMRPCARRGSECSAHGDTRLHQVLRCIVSTPARQVSHPQETRRGRATCPRSHSQC